MASKNEINCPNCGYTDPGEKREHCIYCHRAVPAGFGVPYSDDDTAWRNAVALHAEGCEWASTRAHTV